MSPHNICLSNCNKVTYCVSAWGSFIKEFYISKINSLFRKAVKYGYTDTLYDFHGLLLHHDEKLYSKIIFDNHCLNHLLSSFRHNGATQLRDRGHSYDLPRYKTDLLKESFVTRVLYANK